MAIEKSLYEAPMGLESLTQEPELEIEIEDPESVKIRTGDIEIEIDPDQDERRTPSIFGRGSSWRL